MTTQGKPWCIVLLYAVAYSLLVMCTSAILMYTIPIYSKPWSPGGTCNSMVEDFSSGLRPQVIHVARDAPQLKKGTCGRRQVVWRRLRRRTQQSGFVMRKQIVPAWMSCMPSARQAQHRCLRGRAGQKGVLVSCTDSLDDVTLTSYAVCYRMPVLCKQQLGQAWTE